MKFEAIVKELEKGNNPKIYVVNNIDPFLFTGYVQKVIINGGKRIDLVPYIGLDIDGRAGKLYHKIPGNLQIGNLVIEGSLVKSKEYPNSIIITSSFKQHEKQALMLIKELFGRETEAFKRYLTLAEKL